MRTGLFSVRNPNENARMKFRERWAGFKDKFEEFDKKQKGNDRVQSFIHQIRLRIKDFDKASAEEAEKEKVDGERLKKCLSQTEKYLDTIYWLVYDYEKSQIEEIAVKLALVNEFLGNKISPSELKEEKNEPETEFRTSHSDI